MKADVFEYEGKVFSVYMTIKNGSYVLKLKPNNDIEKIQYLEVHHATDEQFILVQRKAVLLTASRENDAFKIDVIPMEPNKVYNVLQGTWFNTITQKDTKLIYVQDAGTTTENSEYCDMTEVELSMVREKAKKALQ